MNKRFSQGIGGWRRLGSLAAITMLAVSFSAPATWAAQPCTYRCGSNQIRFMPGQPITIQFVNRTQERINLERVLDIDMYWLRPQAEFEVETIVGADADMSLVFWNEQNRAIKAVLHRPEVGTLQIEFLPSGTDSDRAVHVVNDGRVLVY
ncbi:MAG: hypothetical protein WBB01_10040 [Phormidesmis sp.]